MRYGLKQVSVVLLSLVSVVLAACDRSSAPQIAHLAPVSYQIVPLQPGDYTSPAWVESGWIVFTKYPDLTVVHQQVWRVRPDGSALEELTLPGDSSCHDIHYDYPTALSDGRVGLEQECGFENPGRFQSALVAYDLLSGKTSPLTGPLVQFSAANFTWDPNANHGLAAQSSMICAVFAAVDHGGIHPLAVALGSGGRSWRLDEAFNREISTESCTQDGLADHPSLSPDGRQVAFFASPAAIGVADQARLDVKWSLWLMGAAGDHPHAMLEGVVEPTDVAWSPDGRWLAYNARRGAYRGVWLYSPTTGVQREVSATDGSRVSWSPDGRQLVALHDTGTTENPQSQLVVYDVSGLLGH